MSLPPTTGLAIHRASTTRGAAGIHLGIIHRIILGMTFGTTPGYTILGIHGTIVGMPPGTHGIGAATTRRGTTIVLGITPRTDGVGDMPTIGIAECVEAIVTCHTAPMAAETTALEVADMPTVLFVPQADTL